MIYVMKWPMMHCFCLCVRGYKRFFKRAQLEASTFLKDDCLKINCTVGVVVSSIDCSKLNTIQVPDSDIGSHFGMLLENEEGSDVTFSVGGERFPAHKLVLAARSTAFETEFFNGMEEDDRDIAVTDMEPKVFKVVALFLKNVLPTPAILLQLVYLLFHVTCLLINSV